jgi:peptidoglycan/LPS O-acetylase OafA/YrhL
MASTRSKRDIPALTGLRALAAALVLILHTDQTMGGGANATIGIISRGYLGVDLFFLLSGFVIAHVYQDTLATANRRTIAIFLWHRIVRIYPIHLFTLLVLICMVLGSESIDFHLNHEEAFTPATLPAQLLMLQAWGVVNLATWNIPAWSVSAEWFAYLCFPAVAVLIGKVRHPIAAGIVAAISLGATYVAFSFFGWSVATSWLGAPALLRILGSFVCGASLCRLATLQNSINEPSTVNDFAALASILLATLACFDSWPDFFIIALFALLVVAIATSRSVAAWIFSRPPILWLGEISYSVYMAHFPVLRVLSLILKPTALPLMNVKNAALYLVAIAVCIAAGATLYYLIERPVRVRFRDFFGRNDDSPMRISR